MNKPVVYLHSSEQMKEVADNSVDLFLGASVYLTGRDGKCAEWERYAELYWKVYGEGVRVLKRSGLFLLVQTNAYSEGKFICRYKYILSVMENLGYVLIDERVWERSKADHFQVPFSHVLVFTPPKGTKKRSEMNKSSREWFQGVWKYPQNKTIGSSFNAYPPPYVTL